MAIIGCSYVKVAIYGNVGTTVTYTNPAIIAKLVRCRFTLDNGNDNDFFADNGPAESDSQFAGGSVELVTDDLTDEASALILGLNTTALENIAGITDENVEEILYDDDQDTPYMGIGVVIKHKRKGKLCYTGIVLPKIMFNIPEDAADTQGKTISWQTPTITGKIFKDDTEKHRWKRKATFSTEGQAIAYVNARTGGVAA